MRCPRCGHEMTIDSHRKIPLNMCYECGYIEGRASNTIPGQVESTNFAHLMTLNFNEAVGFIAQNLGVSEAIVDQFLDAPYSDTTDL